MRRLWPSVAELELLEFVRWDWSLRRRLLTALGLFLAGLFLVLTLPGILKWAGLLVLLAGHLPLWVKGLTIAPGGATPDHEEVWAPADPEWRQQVAAQERRAKAWDASPWDVTNSRGAALLVIFLGAIVVGLPVTAGLLLGSELTFRVMIAAAGLVVPQYLNGMRTRWNPSELKLKGEALAVAEAAAGRLDGDLEPVPLLALRQGTEGKYPVDARLMLRPAGDDGSGFLGVQVQVSINNVQGRDYPYLYCVVLGKRGFELPRSRRRHERPGYEVELVTKRGEDGEVDFLVVRQHADKSGGWHTEPEQIEQIVGAALEIAAEARGVDPTESPG